mmetsp:Transcript_824/g.2685  ORF Transcript_824/g.2685 Transcript_824/m.2685 type:complete len:204 (+) Transcript_824:3386-3997(+)
MTGVATLIASTCGLPKPSPLLGTTSASAAAYRFGISASAMDGSMPTRGARLISATPSLPASSRTLSRTDPSWWYKSQRKYRATGSCASNSATYASNNSSGALRASHLKTPRKFRTSLPAGSVPSAKVASLARGSGWARARGWNRCVSTASGTTRNLDLWTPAASKTPRPHSVGTQTSSMRLQRATCSGIRLSVSNMARPTTAA